MTATFLALRASGGPLSDEEIEARIAAVANHLMASAAYWIGASADEIVATPSATVGSIGVFTAHQDVSEAMAKAGVKTTLISAGKYKVERNGFSPLGDEALANVQADVDGWYSMMTSSIAKGRGVSVDEVRGSAYGEGRTLMAKKALDRQMVDRIDSLENTIRRVARGAIGSRSNRLASPGAYLVAVDGAEVIEPEGVGAAPSFAARVEAAAAEVREIGAIAKKRAELRAEEGREPSEADRLALALVAGSPDPEPEPVEPEDQADSEAEEAETPVATRRRADLELFEAATSRGYALPH